MLRISVAACCVFFLLTASANAALMGTATLIRDPGGEVGAPTAAFAAPEALLGSPWVSYQLSVTSDEGNIASWSFRIDTDLHQRWSDGDFDDDPTNGKTITGTVSSANGDSHLTPAAGALAGAGIGAPDEDNDYLPPAPDSPLTDSYVPGAGTGGIAWGVGSFLKGDYGLLAATQTASADIAKIVIPVSVLDALAAGDLGAMTISARAGNPTGVQIGGTLDACDFFFCGTSTTGPEIEVRGNGVVILDGDNTPDTGDHTDFGTNALGSSPQRTYTIHNTGDADLDLGALFLTGDAEFQLIGAFPDGPIGAGGNAIFTIGLNTALEGTFNGNVSFENFDSDENPYSFDITGIVAVPEPASLMLVGLAMLGLVGYKRRHAA